MPTDQEVRDAEYARAAERREQAYRLLTEVGVQSVTEHAGLEFTLRDSRTLTFWHDDEYGCSWDLGDSR